METALLRIDGNEVGKEISAGAVVAADLAVTDRGEGLAVTVGEEGSAVTDRRCSSSAIREFESEVALAPVRAGRMTVWREIRVKVVPAVVFLLTVAAIVYFWPPF